MPHSTIDAAWSTPHVLVALLASLRHPDGRIAVDGFYDQVKELTAEERTALAELGLDEAALMGDQSATSGPTARQGSRSPSIGKGDAPPASFPWITRRSRLPGRRSPRCADRRPA